MRTRPLPPPQIPFMGFELPIIQTYDDNKIALLLPPLDDNELIYTLQRSAVDYERLIRFAKSRANTNRSNIWGVGNGGQVVLQGIEKE